MRVVYSDERLVFGMYEYMRFLCLCGLCGRYRTGILAAYVKVNAVIDEVFSRYRYLQSRG